MTDEPHYKAEDEVTTADGTVTVTLDAYEAMIANAARSEALREIDEIVSTARELIEAGCNPSIRYREVNTHRIEKLAAALPNTQEGGRDA